MDTLQNVLTEQLKDPEFCREYAAAEKELEGFDKILKLRTEAGLTQEAVAQRMGTSEAAVAHLETRLAQGDFPSVRSMQRYAEALGKRLEVRFV